MFFRNLTLFRFSPAVATDLKRLDEVLADHRLRPCGPLEMFTRVSCRRSGAAMKRRSRTKSSMHVVHRRRRRQAAACAGDQRGAAAQGAENRRRRRPQGRRPRAQAHQGGSADELLPRAFVRSSRMSAYVDRKNGWLVLDTSSRKSAENALTQIREALGSFPAVPLAPEEGPRVLMTDWLANGNLPAV
jgi:recombination associated protein RdgC